MAPSPSFDRRQSTDVATGQRGSAQRAPQQPSPVFRRRADFQDWRETHETVDTDVIRSAANAPRDAAPAPKRRNSTQVIYADTAAVSGIERRGSSAARRRRNSTQIPLISTRPPPARKTSSLTTEADLVRLEEVILSLDKSIVEYLDEQQHCANASVWLDTNESRKIYRSALKNGPALWDHIDELQKYPSRIRSTYLTDDGLTVYWDIACGIIEARVAYPAEDYCEDPSLVLLKSVAQTLRQMQGLLVSLYRDDIITEDHLMLVEQRWSRFDTLRGFLAEEKCQIDAKTWIEMHSRLLQERQRRESQSLLSLTPTSAFYSDRHLDHSVFANDDTASFITAKYGNLLTLYNLWILLIITSAVTAALFAIGYSKSTHRPGSTADDDFWYSLQNAVMQVLGIFFSILPLLKVSHASKHTWLLPAILAILTTLAATPLYMLVPKEWSAFCMMFGNAVQAYLALQIVAVR